MIIIENIRFNHSNICHFLEKHRIVDINQIVCNRNLYGLINNICDRTLNQQIRKKHKYKLNNKQKLYLASQKRLIIAHFYV